MIEYQGWMSVWGHWLEEEEDAFDYASAYEKIQTEFKKKFSHDSLYHENNCFIKLGFFNGRLRITTIGDNNRKTNIFQNILDFFILFKLLPLVPMAFLAIMTMSQVVSINTMC